MLQLQLGVLVRFTESHACRSLEMRFKLLPILPWTPTAAFTGTTDYTIDPYNGLIRKHIDKWDSIQDNQNLSIEGLRYTLLSFAQACGLLTS